MFFAAEIWPVAKHVLTSLNFRSARSQICFFHDIVKPLWKFNMLHVHNVTVKCTLVNYIVKHTVLMYAQAVFGVDYKTKDYFIFKN